MNAASFSASLSAARVLLLPGKQQPTDRRNSRRGNSSSSSNTPPPPPPPHPLLLLFLSSPLCLSLSALLPLCLLPPISPSPFSLPLIQLLISPAIMLRNSDAKKTGRKKRETLTISGAACSSNDPNRRLLVCTLTHPIGHNHISFSIHPFTHRLFSCALNTRGPPMIKLILLIWKAAMTVWLAHRRGGQASFETKQRGSVNHYATISGQKASSGHPPAVLPALLPPLLLWKPYTRKLPQLMCYNWPIWTSTIALPPRCRNKHHSCTCARVAVCEWMSIFFLPSLCVRALVGLSPRVCHIDETSLEKLWFLSRDEATLDHIYSTVSMGKAHRSNGSSAFIFNLALHSFQL